MVRAKIVELFTYVYHMGKHSYRNTEFSVGPTINQKVKRAVQGLQKSIQSFCINKNNNYRRMGQIALHAFVKLHYIS